VATRQFEPMSVGQILDAAIWIYRRNFVRFVVIASIVQVPLAVVSVVVTRIVQSAIVTTPEAQFETGFAVRMAESLVTLFVAIMGEAIAKAALVTTVSESYLGREMTAMESFRLVLSRAGAVIAAGLLVALLVAIGTLVFIVPGILLALWLALTIPAVMLERRGPVGAMRRSRWLLAGNLGKIFVLSVVVFLMGLILWSSIALGGRLLSEYVAGGNEMASVVITHLARLIASILALPIGAGAATLLYYDLRIRKEGLDLEMLVPTLGAEGETSPSATAGQ